MGKVKFHCKFNLAYMTGILHELAHFSYDSQNYQHLNYFFIIWNYFDFIQILVPPLSLRWLNSSFEDLNFHISTNSYLHKLVRAHLFENRRFVGFHSPRVNFLECRGATFLTFFRDCCCFLCNLSHVRPNCRCSAKFTSIFRCWCHLFPLRYNFQNRSLRRHRDLGSRFLPPLASLFEASGTQFLAQGQWFWPLARAFIVSLAILVKLTYSCLKPQPLIDQGEVDGLVWLIHFYCLGGNLGFQ